MMEERDLVNDQCPTLVDVEVDNPGRSYSQEELIKLLDLKNEKLVNLFTNSHIKSRNLCLPDHNETTDETSIELWNKHKSEAIHVSKRAIQNLLDKRGIHPNSIDYIACVTSTGYLCPGLTAHLIKEIGFKSNIHRVDIVGMGCNAGLNGMQPLINYCHHTNGYALLVCVEICSAAYLNDNSINTAVVNSLFGDGCAVALFGSSVDYYDKVGPKILGFESFIATEQIDSMRFKYNGQKFYFSLSRDIPYVIGSYIDKPVSELLKRFGLKTREIKHWIIHSGGKKVLDSIKYTLNISSYDIRHTESVLKDFGNVSSGSFLFSLKRLIDEGEVSNGDYVMMITMGPGATIECCLGQF